MGTAIFNAIFANVLGESLSYLCVVYSCYRLRLRCV